MADPQMANNANFVFLVPEAREISDLLARANHETLDMLVHCAAVPASSAAPLADLWAAQAANLRALLAQAALAASITEEDHSHA